MPLKPVKCLIKYYFVNLHTPFEISKPAQAYTHTQISYGFDYKVHRNHYMHAQEDTISKLSWYDDNVLRHEQQTLITICNHIAANERAEVEEINGTHCMSLANLFDWFSFQPHKHLSLDKCLIEWQYVRKYSDNIAHTTCKLQQRYEHRYFFFESFFEA